MANDLDQLTSKYPFCEMLQNSEASQPNIIIDLRIFRIDVTDYCEALPQDPLKHQGNSELDEKSIE